jgi:hypothetical protein
VPTIRSATPLGSGQAGAFEGLVFEVPAGTSRISSATRLGQPFARLFTDSFHARADDFNEGFPGVARRREWFIIRYDGDFNAPTQGVYKFRMTVDDGAILAIDGEPVINGDGVVHAATTFTGEKALRPGPHRMQVDYLRTTGPVVLGIFVTTPGSAETMMMGARRTRHGS